MNENVKKFQNPYERLIEVTKELNELSDRELKIKNMSQKEQKSYKRELDENETKQLFLFIEKESYENCINWLEVYKKGFEDKEGEKLTK